MAYIFNQLAVYRLLLVLMLLLAVENASNAQVQFETSDREVKELYDAAEKRCLDNISSFGKRQLLVEGPGYPHVWLETQPMGGEMYAKRNVQLALNNQLIFMDFQRVDGRLPGRIRNEGGSIIPDYGWIQGFCFPHPALNMYYWMGKDPAYLQKLYDCLSRFDAYLWRVRDSDGDGCLESWCVYDTGEDYSIRLDGSPLEWPYEFAPNDSLVKAYKAMVQQKHVRQVMPVPVESMDFMSYSYAARAVLAEISGLLNNGKSEAWKAKATVVRNKIKSYLWDPQRAACFDRDANNTTIDILLHNNIRAMYYGSFDQEMADAFIEKHLFNPKEFWTPMPLPSIAANDEAFRNVQDNDWSGQPQGLTFQRTITALENYGHYAGVAKVGRRLIDVLKREKKFAQQYDPFTGKAGSRADGYGPTMLAFLEYISRMQGIHYTRDKIWWSGLNSGQDSSSYEQVILGKRYLLKLNRYKMEGFLNGKQVFSISPNVRLVTDMEGKLLDVVGIDSVIRNVAISLSGSPKKLRIKIKPNQVFRLQPVKVAASDKKLIKDRKTTYYIDPIKGNDQNQGIAADKTWKTFRHLNQLRLSAGDRVEVLAAGTFNEPLVVKARGTAASPVTVNFAPGRYDFFPDKSSATRLHISNTNDTPEQPKAMAMLFDSCQHVSVSGSGAKMVMRGKMLECYVRQSSNLSFDGISFDYKRPTVSELKVIDVGPGYADLSVHKDTKFSIKDSMLTWEGEGWRHLSGSLWQWLDEQRNELKRVKIPIGKIRYVLTGDQEIRAFFPSELRPFQMGMVYQSRDLTRDCAGIFMERSKDISWKNINIYFMHGMGVVSQFCEHISFENFNVRPEEGSGRTCAAWADILHFSGCKGKIEVAGSYLSAANDDAVNVHGTHLRVMDAPGINQVDMEFVHSQTYGFDAFAQGDSVVFVRPGTLLPFAAPNVVTVVERLTDKVYRLTLKNPVPEGIVFGEDVMENITWTPEVWIHDNVIARIPTRGMLITTRRKSLIERNQFLGTFMSAIAVNDDASDWYESGPVRDLLIKENQFLKCGEPVIDIHPENKVGAHTAVHSGISVIENNFLMTGTALLRAKSSSGINISNNTITLLSAGKEINHLNHLIALKDCGPVTCKNNQIRVQ